MLPNRPLANTLSTPPRVMLKALDSTMSLVDKSTVNTRLRAAEQMGTTANTLMYNLGEIVKGLPNELFGQEVVNGIAQTAMLSITLKKESDRMLLLATNQLQHTMWQALYGQTTRNRQSAWDNSYGAMKGSPVLGMIGGEGSLALNADFVTPLKETDSTVPQSWEAPSYRYNDHGGLSVSKRDGPSAIDISQSQSMNRNGVGSQKDRDSSRESNEIYWNAVLHMYRNRPRALGRATAVVENNADISAAEGRRLYVAYLPYSITEAELIDFLRGFSM
jgi:hypothetical protein